MDSSNEGRGLKTKDKDIILFHVKNMIPLMEDGDGLLIVKEKKTLNLIVPENRISLKTRKKWSDKKL